MGAKTENVDGMKLGEWENPERNPKNPDIARRNYPPGDTETRIRGPTRERRAVIPSKLTLPVTDYKSQFIRLSKSLYVE